MTDTSSTDRIAWRTSADCRDEETRSIYGITVHGSREGTRFYADRA